MKVDRLLVVAFTLQLTERRSSFTYQTGTNVEARPRELNIFETNNGGCPYSEWLGGLDRKTRARIRVRVARLEDGNFGDCEPAGEGVQELKLHFGPGYRVYFALHGRNVVLLLCGGDKSSQTKDIKAAKALWREYKRQNA